MSYNIRYCPCVISEIVFDSENATDLECSLISNGVDGVNVEVIMETLDS